MVSFIICPSTFFLSFSIAFDLICTCDQITSVFSKLFTLLIAVCYVWKYKNSEQPSCLPQVLFHLQHINKHMHWMSSSFINPGNEAFSLCTRILLLKSLLNNYDGLIASGDLKICLDWRK